MRKAAIHRVSFLLVIVITTAVWADDWKRICLDYTNEVVPVWNEHLTNNYYDSETSLTAKCYKNEAFIEWSNGELGVGYIDMKYLCRNYTNASLIDYIEEPSSSNFASNKVFEAAGWDECIFFGCLESDGGDFFYTFMPVSCTWSQEECDPESSDCNQNNSTCNTTIGNSVCSCYTGYSGNGFSCTNIDECSEGRHTCNKTNSTCIDTIGNYTCECSSGYEGHVTNCTNIDECTLGTHTCHHNATCTDTAGEFNCTCKSGFEGDGINCTNINECTTNGHNCHQNAICSDAVGGFECNCTEGYEGDGIFCKNINECMTNGHSCHQNAICSDTVGGFECNCTEGYEGDGIFCTNINECMTNGHSCHQNANCSDTVGGFECNCTEGYEGDGVSCIKSAGVSPSLGLIALILVLILFLALLLGFLIFKMKERRENARYSLPPEKLICDPHCQLVSATAPPYKHTGSMTTIISEFDDLHIVDESKEKSIIRDKLDAGIRIKETPNSLQETSSSEHCSLCNEYVTFAHASENSLNTTAEHCNAERAESSEQQDSQIHSNQTVSYICESDVSG